MKKQIIVTVTPDGQTKVVAEGFAGGECREATKFLRAALGQPVQEQLTEEYYQSQLAIVQSQESGQFVDRRS